MKVVLVAQAVAQVETIDAWWRAHRRAVPDLFADEFARAIEILRDRPEIGALYPVGGQTVRRLLLRRSRYHLYYVQGVDDVRVVAVWSAFRGHGPSL